MYVSAQSRRAAWHAVVRWQCFGWGRWESVGQRGRKWWLGWATGAGSETLCSAQGWRMLLQCQDLWVGVWGQIYIQEWKAMGYATSGLWGELKIRVVDIMLQWQTVAAFPLPIKLRIEWKHANFAKTAKYRKKMFMLLWGGFWGNSKNEYFAKLMQSFFAFTGHLVNSFYLHLLNIAKDLC